MINVFLLGDSIKGFYKPRVEELLGSDYRIWTPSENCRFAKYTLNSLRHYFAAMESQNFFPDIIHWNVGLWDLNHLYNTGKPFTELDEYIRDMSDILVQLKKTGAKIILATTTPTRKERETTKETQHFNSEICAYNKRLVEALGDKVDYINDLYSAVIDKTEEYISDDYLHPSPQGIEVLAEKVADSIKSFGDVSSNKTKNWDWFGKQNVDEIQESIFR